MYDVENEHVFAAQWEKRAILVNIRAFGYTLVNVDKIA